MRCNHYLLLSGTFNLLLYLANLQLVLSTHKRQNEWHLSGWKGPLAPVRQCGLHEGGPDASDEFVVESIAHASPNHSSDEKCTFDTHRSTAPQRAVICASALTCVTASFVGSELELVLPTHINEAKSCHSVDVSRFDLLQATLGGMNNGVQINSLVAVITKSHSFSCSLAAKRLTHQQVLL